MTAIKPDAAVSFTGTRRGMTPAQTERLADLLDRFHLLEFHHGDCIGADNEADDLVVETCPDCVIVVHPPDNDSKRAFVARKGAGAREVRPSAPYLMRNRDIVDEGDLLVACPATSFEELRSGTWATVRYARRVGKPIFIIYPAGTLAEEGEAKAWLHIPE